jgi:hypothetical protein
LVKEASTHTLCEERGRNYLAEEEVAEEMRGVVETCTVCPKMFKLKEG